MGANASKVKYGFDTAAGVTLRNVTDGAETATATETAVDLGLLNAAYWNDNTVPHGTFAVVFDVTALTTSGDATYTLSLQVDDVLAHNDTPTTVWSQLITATGVYTAVLDSKTIDELVTDYSGNALYLAAKVTIGGSTGKSITYGAWIADVVAP